MLTPYEIERIRRQKQQCIVVLKQSIAREDEKIRMAMEKKKELEKTMAVLKRILE